MKLNVLDRLLLLGLLPEKGNAATLRIVRQLRERLSFTEADHEKYEIIVLDDNSGVQWNIEKGEEESEITLGATAQRIVVDTLEEMDRNEELEMQHLSLLDKFGIGED